MNHLEAQKLIVPFIEDRIPEDRQEDFVIHMKNCKKCHDELETYYTLLVGMKQLDNHEKLSTDFNRDLEDKLDRLERRVKNRKGVRFSAFSVVLAGILTILVILYSVSLNRVYDFEQKMKKQEQGTYYFARTLGPDMLPVREDRAQETRENQQTPEIPGYERIRGYVRLQEDTDRLLDISEKIAARVREENEMQGEGEKSHEFHENAAD